MTTIPSGFTERHLQAAEALEDKWRNITMEGWDVEEAAAILARHFPVSPASEQLKCPPEFETATGTFDPAGYDPTDCAGCGCPKEEHIAEENWAATSLRLLAEIDALRESLEASVTEERRLRVLHQQEFGRAEQIRTGVTDIMCRFVQRSDIPVGIRAELSAEMHKVVPIGGYVLDFMTPPMTEHTLSCDAAPASEELERLKATCESTELSLWRLANEGGANARDLFAICSKLRDATPSPTGEKGTG